MRFSRVPFDLKTWLWAIVLLALIVIVSVSGVLIQGGQAGAERLRASSAEAEAKAYWARSIEEWRRFEDSSAFNKLWADGMRSAAVPTSRPGIESRGEAR